MVHLELNTPGMTDPQTETKKKPIGQSMCVPAFHTRGITKVWSHFSPVSVAAFSVGAVLLGFGEGLLGQRNVQWNLIGLPQAGFLTSCRSCLVVEGVADTA